MKTTKEERDNQRYAVNWLIENNHEDAYYCPDDVTSEFFLRLLDDADRCAELEAQILGMREEKIDAHD